MNYPARIVHPEHGATHVYNGAEWDAHKARGWEVEAEEVAEAAPVAKKKPGPKPKAVA